MHALCAAVASPSRLPVHTRRDAARTDREASPECRRYGGQSQRDEVTDVGRLRGGRLPRTGGHGGHRNSSLSALVTFCLPLLTTSIRFGIVAGTANFVFVADP
jgi:hypothetical protein